MAQFPPPVPAGAAPAGVDLVWSTLRGMWAGLLERLPYVALGLVVLLLFHLAGRLVRRAAHAAGERTRLDVRLADVLGTLGVVGLTVLGAFVAAVIVFPAFQPGDLVAGLGISSVAVGFAFKDILQNFFAGILILLRRPFVVGDQIRVKDFEGTVEEINTRSTRLTTYDGERVILPNGDVYTSSILVRTAYDTRRVKFTVGVGYPDSVEQAREAILGVVRGTEGVLAEPGPWAYVEELAPSSVNFTVYFWTGSRQADVLRVRDRVATGIKQALDRAGIDMPFPHTVLLFHDQTGTRDGDRTPGAPPTGTPRARPGDPESDTHLATTEHPMSGSPGGSSPGTKGGRGPRNDNHDITARHGDDLAHGARHSDDTGASTSARPTVSGEADTRRQDPDDPANTHANQSED